MMQPPVYPIEGPDQDADLAEQLLGAQRDGLALVLRDLGMEVSRNLAAQEEALARVTNALKRRIQTSLRGQVKALIPVMDAIHGRVASSLAEQQVALSTLMDQPAFQCVRGEPRQDPSGRWGCYYDGAVHYDDPAAGQVAGMPLYPTTVGMAPAPTAPATGAAPTTTTPAVAPPGAYPVPAPGSPAAGQPSDGGEAPPPAMCCPPCPAPASSTPTDGGAASSTSTGGAGGAAGDSTSSPGTTGAAGAGSSPPCPAALGYPFSQCGIDSWREGASGLMSSEVVQAALLAPDWVGALLPGAYRLPAEDPFPSGVDYIAAAEPPAAPGFFSGPGED
jgi:hypothetical protein